MRDFCEVTHFLCGERYGWKRNQCKAVRKEITDILQKNADEFNLDVSTVVGTKESLVVAKIISVMEDGRYTDSETIDIITRILRSNGLFLGMRKHKPDRAVFR